MDYYKVKILKSIKVFRGKNLNYNYFHFDRLINKNKRWLDITNDIYKKTIFYKIQ